jgi:hypothetical protein
MISNTCITSTPIVIANPNPNPNPNPLTTVLINDWCEDDFFAMN